MNFHNSPEFISSDLAKDWKNFQRTLIKPSVDGRILSLLDESGQRIGQGLSLEQHYFNLAPGYRYWHGVTDINELNVSTL